MNNVITNPKFFTAGKAIFTVSNPKGERYTFKVSHSKPEQPFFVSVMKGSDNENSYSYVGLLNPDTHDVRLTVKSKFAEDTKEVKVVRWAIAQVVNNKQLPDGYVIQHAGRCGCCGRVLTVPESIESGFGPECREKMERTV